MFQATLPVPGQVIPNDPAVERAVLAGERLFDQIGCNQCHIEAAQLMRELTFTPQEQSSTRWPLGNERSQQWIAPS